MERLYKPWHYFLMTFVLTFIFWGAGAYLSFDETSYIYLVFVLAGLFCPFIVCVFMIFTSKNSFLKKSFIRKLFNPRLINIKMIPFLIFFMPFSVVVSVFISVLFGQSLDQLTLSQGFSFSTGFIPVFLVLFLAAVFEELGWRGYAFESLEQEFSRFNACIIFSVLWSLWHLPLIFIKNTYQYEIFHMNIWYCINFYFSIIPLGVIVSWFCIKNNKSIISAVVFHLIINLSQEAFNITQNVKVIQSFVLTGFAVLIVCLDKNLFFNKKESLDE